MLRRVFDEGRWVIRKFGVIVVVLVVTRKRLKVVAEVNGVRRADVVDLCRVEVRKGRLDLFNLS